MKSPITYYDIDRFLLKVTEVQTLSQQDKIAAAPAPLTLWERTIIYRMGLIALCGEGQFSTNFVAFKYPIMIMMALAYELTKNNDDEHLMTVSLPALFGLKKYIFQKLIVCHLSFFKQDENLQASEIIDQYTKRFYPSI